MGWIHPQMSLSVKVLSPKESNLARETYRSTLHMDSNPSLGTSWSNFEIFAPTTFEINKELSYN